MHKWTDLTNMGTDLTCGTVNLIKNCFRLLYALHCVTETLNGRYSTVFEQNGKMKYFSRQWPYQEINPSIE